MQQPGDKINCFRFVRRFLISLIFEIVTVVETLFDLHYHSMNPLAGISGLLVVFGVIVQVRS